MFKQLQVLRTQPGNKTSPRPKGAHGLLCLCVGMDVGVRWGGGYRKRNMLGVDQCQKEKQDSVRGM